jgi:hypothetical protein
MCVMSVKGIEQQHNTVSVETMNQHTHMHAKSLPALDCGFPNPESLVTSPRHYASAIRRDCNTQDVMLVMVPSRRTQRRRRTNRGRTQRRRGGRRRRRRLQRGEPTINGGAGSCCCRVCKVTCAAILQHGYAKVRLEIPNPQSFVLTARNSMLAIGSDSN